ncbi:MAG: orotate phosphoribosyltransferase [Alphaproteobacteria bacterium]|nr:orotate phosphoribosyltransferase [Alphaproteobacteria bacterium]
MNRDEVLRYFTDADALLEGHFILSSGLHAARYLQCARVLMDPVAAAKLCRGLVDKITAQLEVRIDLVVSPAMGGVVVGYEMARQLGVKSIFTERVDGALTLRRGFEIPPGARILMAEDIVTTGLSSRECIRLITDYGGEVVAASCLIDRSNGTANVGVPLVSLAQLDIAVYAPDELPADLASLPAVKPGSRGLEKQAPV